MCPQLCECGSVLLAMRKQVTMHTPFLALYLKDFGFLMPFLCAL